ncbi:hypothetical protein [Streptomyces brevispora]|uniref:hypothetical protein n=1 Tax=Streptomyces brevispora TaxID=887462 RepID=UPI003826744E
MSGYGSKRHVRDVVIATLKMEGRNPDAYNIAGIMRDAIHDRGSGYGYGAGTEEEWRAAVVKHRRPFGVGDMVRVVLEVDGLTEHHYGRIAHFRRANGGGYRGTPVKPHSAHIELLECGARTVPLSEVTAADADFEILTGWSEIHADARNPDGYFRCLECGAYTYKAADVKVVHTASRQCVRLCNDCNNVGRRVRLGHSVMWDGRRSKTTILELRANPALITGSDEDGNADSYREWADALPYLVPAEAAELYKQWKEQQSERIAA